MITVTKHTNVGISNFEDSLPSVSSDALNFLGKDLEFSK